MNAKILKIEFGLTKFFSLGYVCSPTMELKIRIQTGMHYK